MDESLNWEKTAQKHFGILQYLNLCPKMNHGIFIVFPKYASTSLIVVIMALSPSNMKQLQ